MAFFFYREVFGVVTLGILNGAAAFVIIGIGKFVYNWQLIELMLRVYLGGVLVDAFVVF